VTIPEVSVLRARPLTRLEVDDHIDYKFSRVEDKVKWSKTRSPAVRIGTSAAKFEVSIFIELNGKIDGIVTLQPPRWNLGSLISMVKDVPKLFTPHTSFRKNLRGLGYAPAIYASYLNRGASFVTDEQTEGAEKLWDKLASQGFKLIYVEHGLDENSKWVNRIVPSNTSKHLTLKCLLGKGVKPENVFYL
jgi:hypothetical protein